MKTKFSIFLTGVIFTIGCGVKGGPYPPLSDNPETVKTARIKQQDNELVVYWQYTPHYEDGRVMKESFRIDIFSMEHRIIKNIEKEGNLYWFRYSFSQVKEYCFRFKVITKRRESRFSKYFCYIPSIKYPTITPDIHLKIKKEGVEILWSENNLKTNIYRTKRNIFYPIPAKTVSKINHYIDRSVISGKNYCYYLTYEDENGVESSPSQIKCVTFKDIFPPSPPKNLKVMRKGKKYYILWSDSDSVDVVGYIIEIDGKKVLEKPIKTYFITVKKLKPNSVIKVYAVDKAGNKSEPVILKLNNEQF